MLADSASLSERSDRVSLSRSRDGGAELEGSGPGGRDGGAELGGPGGGGGLETPDANRVAPLTPVGPPGGPPPQTMLTEATVAAHHQIQQQDAFAGFSPSPRSEAAELESLSGSAADADNVTHEALRAEGGSEDMIPFHEALRAEAAARDAATRNAAVALATSALWG